MIPRSTKQSNKFRLDPFIDKPDIERVHMSWKEAIKQFGHIEYKDGTPMFVDIGHNSRDILNKYMLLGCIERPFR